MKNKDNFLGVANNIASSESWGEAEYLSYFKSRLNAMRTKKAEIDKEFDLCEKQETAISYYNNFGELQVNIPLEQNLIEIYMGRTNGKISFEIIPDGMSDTENVEASKYALEFFLDGNEKDNFWIENKDFRNNKALYGTGIFYTGIRNYKEIQYEIKKGKKLIDGSELQDKNNFNKVERERWLFFPKSIHPRDFYIDDNAYNKPGIQNADDCIWKEKISLIEFKTRYFGNKAFNQAELEKVKLGGDSYNGNECINIYHYFDRITKTWLVVANETNLIYNGIYLYDDGKLPFEMVQHYTSPNSIWGRGVPNRIRYLKAYKNEILQDILVGAEMSSGINLLAGNDAQIGQDWNVGGRGINIWRTVGGANNVQTISTQANLGYFSQVLQILDDLVVQDTGDNMKAPIDAQSDRVGIVEIMEANKAVRQSSVDENYNLGIDSVLTMTLARIKQFAPSLLGEKLYNKKGDKVIKYIFPKIKVIDYKEIGGNKKLINDLKKKGYFELKPELIAGIGSKVATASTNSMLPVLERKRVQEYIDNLKKLFELSSVDQTIGELIKERTDFDSLITWLNKSYGYNNNVKKKLEEEKTEAPAPEQAQVPPLPAGESEQVGDVKGSSEIPAQAPQINGPA